MPLLSQDFFQRDTLTVARELLGKFLVADLSGVAGSRHPQSAHKALMIHEVEAYIGSHDLASHASRGLTPRTKVMFGPAGFWYVYFVYGIHWMLNIVTEREGFPGAVLIRGAGEVSGPARLTKLLGLTGRFNGLTASSKTGLWIEDRGLIIPARKIKKTPRIGVDYAGPIWSKKPYRFTLASTSSITLLP